MQLDLLRIVERVQIAVSLGESHFREFKSALHGAPTQRNPRDVKDVAADVGRTLVAFANADGGELLVGVEDDGTVTGVPHEREALDVLLKAPQTHVHSTTPLSQIRVSRVDFQGHQVLYFSVPKGTEYVYITSDGRCLQRKDRDSLPIAAESIQLSRAERSSREYDRTFVDGASVDDLNLQLVYEVANRISKGMSVERCLQHLELAEFDGTTFRIRRAALLLFGRDVRKWHPRSRVRLLRIRGTVLKSGEEYNVVADQEVTDSALALIEAGWELIRPHLTETRFSGDALFRTQIIYPEAACREALINAIAHRDYSNEGRGIEVHVYDDRLTFVSPGALLSSISVDDLRARKGVHQSRNAFVARVLREIGYMRELGEGLRRIYELMQSSDLAPPDIESAAGHFAITLHQKFVYSKEERLWLERFASQDLSREQSTVIRLGYNEHVISPKEIWDAVGIVDTEAYRRLIDSLTRRGLVRSVVGKHAASRLAKVRRIQRKEVPRYRVVEPPAVDTAHDGTEASQAAVSVAAPVSEPDESEYVRVFVGNIPFDISQEELAEAFERFGAVSEVFAPLAAYSRKTKGYAFVEFETREAAQAAINSSGRIVVGERTLYIQPARPKSDRDTED